MEDQVPVRRKHNRRRAVPLTPERRMFNATVAEVRESAETNEIVITGTPIVFNSPYVVHDAYGSFEERMNPSVGEDIASRDFDVRLLFNHEGLPLARTRSGTMQLENTPTALRMTATIDARQQLANDLMVALERRDVSEMSVGFLVARDEWSEEYDRREIFQFEDMLDASIVSFAASPTTQVDIARRMALAIPVESRARVRQRYINARKTGDVNEALEAVRPFIDMEERDVDVDPGEDTRTPTGTGRLGSPDGDGDTYADAGTDGSVGGGGPGDNADASGTRDGQPTEAERRTQVESLDDGQRAAYDALLASGWAAAHDAYPLDIGRDWIVWRSPGDNAAVYHISYSADDEGTVTLRGEPQVIAQANEPEQTSQTSRAKALHLRAKALRASQDA